MTTRRFRDKFDSHSLTNHFANNQEPMKSNSTKITQLLAALGIVGMMSVATAQTTNLIFGTDFEGNGNYSFSYGYAFAGSDAGVAAQSFAGTVTAGVGVTNSSAYSGSPDYTLTGTDPNYIGLHAYTYSGMADHIVFSGPINPLTPTANLDSFILSFDANVGGLLTNLSSTTMGIELVDFKTAGATTFRFNGNVNVTSNFVHFDIPLSALTFVTGGGRSNVTDFTNSAVLSAIDSFEIEFRVTGEVGDMGVDRSPVFGFDNDNTLVVDNIFLNQTSATVPPPKYEKVIWEINFDDKQPGNTYGFVFRDGANAATITTITNATGGVGGSAGLEGTADLSSWQATPPTGFSGFGVGAGKETPYTLTSSNKASYRVYWTAKTGGLMTGFDSVNGNASIQFLVPPGTLTPSNPAPAVVLELVPNITLTNDFQSFVFDGSSSPIGIYNGGSQALFNQYVNQVNLVQVQAQYNGGPDIGTVFGYDNDNTMVVDNIKVVELVTGIPPVSVVATNGQIKVYWADPYNVGTAKLQSSTNVAGPYVDVSGAASPYIVPSGSPQQFFRTQWVP